MPILQRFGSGKRLAFTLVEMLVVIAVIAVLAGLLVPSLQRALDASRQAACANQLKQIGLWGMQYADDWNGVLPATDSLTVWYARSNLVDNSQRVYRGTVLHCPQAVASVQPVSSFIRRMNCTYGLSYMLGGGYKPGWPNPPVVPRITYLSSRGYWIADAGVSMPSSADGYSYGGAALCLFWFYDDSARTPWSWNIDPTIPYFQPHPGEMANFIFGDLHIQPLGYWQYNVKSDEEKMRFDARTVM